VREVERSLFFTRIKNNEQQIAIWANDGSESLYLFPRHALPVDPVEALLGHPIANWYASGGKQGKPPRDPRLGKALELLGSAAGKQPKQRTAIAREIWKIIVDEQFSIGTVGLSPAVGGVRIVSKRMGNIPARQVNAQHTRTPAASHPATFYFR
jgi:peptide/nickel transport system substrate-binding protein